MEGLGAAGEAGGRQRFALIFKTHHSLVDGVSGVDLATVLFDLEPTPAPAPTDLQPWTAKPQPSPAELVLAGVRGAVATTAEIVTRALGAAAAPTASLGKIRDAAEGLGEIVWAGLNPAPETPLNVEIGPHRRYTVVRQELAQYKEVKDALGGTVNDVVLTVVSGALARWLRSRGIRTEGLEMRALVPVSVRGKDDHGSLGNRLTVMRGPLPVYIKDPVARLRFVRQAMDGLKESKQAVGAATLAAVNNLAPPTILAQASRLNFSTRLFNLIVTNIPGPQLPLYVLGRQLRDLFPIAFLPANITRWRWRSCPTTARSTSAYSATTTRCPTSACSPRGSRRRCRSCSRPRAAGLRRSRPSRRRALRPMAGRRRSSPRAIPDRSAGRLPTCARSASGDRDRPASAPRCSGTQAPAKY